MYNKLSHRLALANKAGQTTTAQSQPVSMDGYNAALIDCVIYNGNANTLKIEIEGSNDMENWVVLKDGANAYNITATAPDPGYYVGVAAVTASSVVRDVGYAYVRLAYSLTADANEYCVLSAGITPFEE